MNKKQTLISAGVLAVLCGLIYLQVHTWKKFDWHTFWRTDQVKVSYVVLALAITYFLYVLRAVRWRIFLKPLCKTTPSRLIGTAVHWLHRPGTAGAPG